MWEALGFLAAGVIVGLVGQHFRKQYFREFAGQSDDPVHEMNASLMRRGAAIFLTTGAMMIIFGLYFAAGEIWDFLRRG